MARSLNPTLKGDERGSRALRTQKISALRSGDDRTIDLRRFLGLPGGGAAGLALAGCGSGVVAGRNQIRRTMRRDNANPLLG
ncbi:MAG: hypothetical protein V3T64_09615 [Myxococcota bacterium]